MQAGRKRLRRGYAHLTDAPMAARSEFEGLAVVELPSGDLPAGESGRAVVRSLICNPPFLCEPIHRTHTASLGF
jgi:hypothetical protein